MAKQIDTLLRDAIADAKAVKNAAIENAKISLEEAFMPALQNALAKNLKNEADSDEEEQKDDMNESQTGGDDSPVQDGFGPGAIENGEVDKSVLDEELKSSEIGKGNAKEPSAAAHDSSKIENDKKLTRQMGESFVGDEADEREFGKSEGGLALKTETEHPEMQHDGYEQDTLDLDEIMAELEGDVAGDEDNNDFSMHKSFGHDEAPQGAEMGKAPISTSMAGEPGSPQGIEASEKEMHMEPREPGQSASEGEPELDFEMESIMSEIAKAKEAKDSKAEDGHEPVKKLHKENVELRSTLEDYRGAIKFLRSKLLEVNLLNAKLLYTNKLFRNFDLSVGNKMRVVETFDRATTLRETKLVFATLAESFRSGNAPRKKAGSKVVAEGFASKPTGIIKKEEVKNNKTEVLEEGVLTSARLQKIAGILKESR